MTETQADARPEARNKEQDTTRARPRAKARPEDGDVEACVNDVRLVGRLSAAPATVGLPSGDTLVTFRVTVTRSGATRAAPAGPVSGQRVDSVPCTAWSPRLRRSILTWRAGDVVEVEGAVRCRFYQAGGATRSRVEVEASSARIIRRSSAS